MKQQTSRKPMDEREKLRKFRELDDAFAEALRELDDPEGKLDIPTGPPVRSLDDLEAGPAQRQADFEQRLHALMHEYAQSAESVSHLLHTLQALDR